MVILYNRNIFKDVKLPIIKKYKKNKPSNVKISRRTNTQRITLENKKFLKSLGLKVLV